MSDLVTRLQEGKELIARGWTQGVSRRMDGVCVWWAVVETQTGLFRYDAVAVAAVAALSDTRECPGCRSVPYHNDTCLSSHVEVLDWFDRAIRRAKEHPEP